MINTLTIKIRPADRKKIAMAKRLVRQYVDIDHIIASA
jgi:hypothetical protein